VITELEIANGIGKASEFISTVITEYFKLEVK
jgi:hypothetical protein